jgi:hypothetical protein
VYVHTRAHPCKPFPMIDGRKDDRTAGETRGELLKNYQSMQMSWGYLDRKRPVTHSFRLGDGWLRGDGGLKDALVQIRSIEIHHFEDHEDADGSK